MMLYPTITTLARNRQNRSLRTHDSPLSKRRYSDPLQVFFTDTTETWTSTRMGIGQRQSMGALLPAGPRAGLWPQDEESEIYSSRGESRCTSPMLWAGASVDGLLPSSYATNASLWLTIHSRIQVAVTASGSLEASSSLLGTAHHPLNLHDVRPLPVVCIT